MRYLARTKRKWRNKKTRHEVRHNSKGHKSIHESEDHNLTINLVKSDAPERCKSLSGKEEEHLLQMEVF